MKIDNVLLSSEQSVIGSILRDNKAFDEIDLLSHEFCIKCHEIIFNEISQMLGSGGQVDIILLAESLDRKKLLQKAGDLKYIGEIVTNCGTPSTIKSHANFVRNSYKLRQVEALTVDLKDSVNNKASIEEVTEIAEKGLYELLDKDAQYDLVHIRKAVAEAIEYEDQHEIGIETGIRDLDCLLGGFKKSELVIIAGRPSQGKSTLAMQIGEHGSKHGSVIIFSLEMSRRNVAARFIRYHQTKLNKPEAAAYLSGLNLHIDDRAAITLQYVRSQCRRIKRQQGLTMVVIDYLQLMQGVGENRNQEIGSLSRGLKGLAKEFDIPVVLLSQLSRKVEERNDKRPIMSDLRESGEIEQDADVILFVYRDEVYNPNTQDKAIAEIICRKNRNGPIGTVDVLFDGDKSRFFNFMPLNYFQFNLSMTQTSIEEPGW